MFTALSPELLDFPGGSACGSVPAHVLSPRFNYIDGFAWHSPLPGELADCSNNIIYDRQSRLALYEDGTLLSRRHAAHDEIKQQGKGAYSHWYDHLLFSTSDNSDPNTNGRRYTFRLEPETPWILSFGSCHLNDAVLLGLGSREKARPVVSLPTYTLSVPEALQQMAFYRNEFCPTDAEIGFCMSYAEQQIARRGRLKRPDVVFLEVCSPFPVHFRSLILSRAQIIEKIVVPLQNASPKLSELVTPWYFNGIIQRNDALRVEYGTKLRQEMPAHIDHYDVVQAIVAEAQIIPQSRSDLKDSIGQFCELFPNTPILALSHSLRYMPDGRPVSWPGTFYREVNEVCGELGLPIFNTRELAAARGVEFSLTPDLGHYTRAFYDLMADHLYDMMQSYRVRC